MPSVLLIDDNPDILSANAFHLTEEGFDVTAVSTGVETIANLTEKWFDCIVLDILLPDLDGFTLCKSARAITDAPIIFLTCMDDVDDKVKGLMAGGDDYMTKPYSLKELTARIHALIRRGEKNANRQNSGFYIDKCNMMIHTPDKNIFLSQKEFELFILLYENPGEVFSKEELLERIWKADTEAGTVAVHILKLRRKLDVVKMYVGAITNDYGTGYRLMRPGTEG